jgi:hypothetical protein
MSGLPWILRRLANVSPFFNSLSERLRITNYCLRSVSSNLLTFTYQKSSQYLKSIFFFFFSNSLKYILLNFQMPEFSTTVKMNTLISMFHFLLHNSTAHLSNVLTFSQRFAIQWNLLCWKYQIHKFYFGYKHPILFSIVVYHN